MENLEEKVHDIELFMASHDAQCEERWKTTFNRLQEIDETLERIEGKLLHAAGASIIFLGGLVVTMAFMLAETL
tara:strand:- start:897 stop:1118 length:222 start_codon:yes stop_codon:yes gene_type:complete